VRPEKGDRGRWRQKEIARGRQGQTRKTRGRQEADNRQTQAPYP
jgi:hypothetical protein